MGLEIYRWECFACKWKLLENAEYLVRVHRVRATILTRKHVVWISLTQPILACARCLRRVDEMNELQDTQYMFAELRSKWKPKRTMNLSSPREMSAKIIGSIMQNVFLQKFTKNLKETLDRKAAGRSDCKRACLHVVASAPSLPMGISGTLQRFAGSWASVFWLQSSSGPSFVSFSVKSEAPLGCWLLTGKWKLFVLPRRKLSASGRVSWLEPA